LSGLYVYAFVDGAMKPARIGGRRIEFVDVGGLHAAVECLGNPPAPSEIALRTQHDLVARLGKRVDAIVPVRFGTFVMPDELERVVRTRRKALRRGLTRVRGRVQMTTRIFGSRIVKGVPLESRPSSGTDYLLQRKTARDPSGPVLKTLRAAAARYSIDEHVEKGRTPGAAVLFHLIQRDDAVRYRRDVLRAAAAFDRRVAVSVTGPWPPYAFVTDLWS
jgi:hypothetical protein